MSYGFNSDKSKFPLGLASDLPDPTKPPMQIIGELQNQIIDSASIENGATASKAYASGDYVCFQGALCKASKAISQSDTLSIGDSANDNLTLTDAAAEFARLNSDLGDKNILPYPDYPITNNINQINSELSEVTLQRLNALGKEWDFYKVGKVVYLSAPSPTNSSLVVGSNNIGTLPSSYRPKRAAFGKAVNYSGSMYLTVNADGTVILTSDGAGEHNCAISLAYITN